jgi:hypothetical protein
MASFVPNFIQAAENKLYRSLRIRAMEAALSVTIASGTAACPADYLELKFANVSTTPVVSLERSTPEYIYARYPVRSGAEIPRLIARSGDSFIFGPYPGDYTITGIYYKRLPSLNSTSPTTNWFTSYAPNLLLYGALMEAAMMLHDDERMGIWNELYSTEFRSVEMAEKGERWSGSTLAVKAG